MSESVNTTGTIQQLLIERRRLNLALAGYRWEALSQIRCCIDQLKCLRTTMGAASIDPILKEYTAMARAIEAIRLSALPQIESVNGLQQRLQTICERLTVLGREWSLDSTAFPAYATSNDHSGKQPKITHL